MAYAVLWTRAEARYAFCAFLRASAASAILLLNGVSLEAAGSFRPIGGRSGGVGDAYVAGPPDAEGAWWNPAATAGRGMEGWVAYVEPFGLNALGRTVGMARAGWERIGIALSYEDYGPASFHETTAGVQVAARVGPWMKVGLRVRHVRVEVSGLPGRAWTVFDLGFQGGSEDVLRVGAAAWNAGGRRTGILGQGGMGGVRVRATDRVWLMGQIEKESGRTTGGGIGVELRLVRGVWLRGGTGGHPERTAFGVGVSRGPLRIDYAASYHTRLGFTHRVSVMLLSAREIGGQAPANLTP